MTVRRQSRLDLPIPVTEAARLVRGVLNAYREYKDKQQFAEGRVFYTAIQPVIFYLSTSVFIELLEREAGTEIVIHLRSQAWIQGDVFRTYDRMLNRLEPRLAEAAGEPSPATER